MASLEYSTVDTSDVDDVGAYEKALYRAFKPLQSQVLESLWAFDNSQKRVKTAIPYSSQVIFAARLDAAIIGATAINLNMNRRLQLEQMGFSIDKTEPGICEGLALFNLQIFSDSTIVALKLAEHSFHYLKTRSIKKVYGTCAPRLLRGYKNMGFTAVDETEIFGEKRHLLKIIVGDYPQLPGI